jgi:hypothetical protein
MVCGSKEKEGENLNVEDTEGTEFAEKRKKKIGKIVGKELRSLRGTCVPPSETGKKSSERSFALKNLKHVTDQSRNVMIVPVTSKLLRKLGRHIVDIIHVGFLATSGLLFRDQPLCYAF